ncbi:MAG: cytosine deaminase, partial [Weissella confusa]|nr:cytosine deaminase [Weissella confusa]
NFLIFNATNWFDALNERAEMLYSIHNGEVLVETKPAEATINLPE